MKSRWTTLAVILAAASLLSAEKSAVIEHDTVLTADIIVPENTTLTIKPGATLRFDGYHAVVVRGFLICEGTPKEPILVTGIDRPRGSTERPCWQGFTIVGKKADALFRHCRIEGAYRNLVSGAASVFDSCEIVGNHYGIYCTEKSQAHITNCRIYRNTYGLVADYASPILLDNIITENTMGVQLQLSSTILAGRNIIEGNRFDIRSDDAFGENKDVMTVKRLWDLMRQIY